jgi:hypothetical protein
MTLCKIFGTTLAEDISENLTRGATTSGQKHKTKLHHVKMKPLDSERKFNFRGRFAINPVKNEVNTEIKIMRTARPTPSKEDVFSIRSAGSRLPPPGTRRTAPPCKRTGGRLSYANSFARPKISTPTRSFGSTTKMMASSGLTRPA